MISGVEQIVCSCFTHVRWIGEEIHIGDVKKTSKSKEYWEKKHKQVQHI